MSKISETERLDYMLQALDSAILYKAAPMTEETISVEFSPKAAALVVLALDNLMAHAGTEEILTDRMAIFNSFRIALEERQAAKDAE